MWNYSYSSLVWGCFISSATGATKFAIADTKLYASAVTDLKSGFKRKINETNVNQN